jgi:hypothetical protein
MARVTFLRDLLDDLRHTQKALKPEDRVVVATLLDSAETYLPYAIEAAHLRPVESLLLCMLIQLHRTLGSLRLDIAKQVEFDVHPPFP